MTGIGDVGEMVIDRIVRELGCEPRHLTLWRRGLTWYPGGLTQHVWVEETPRPAAVAAWRVHVRTWCLKRVVASSHEMVAAITAELPHNAVGALVRKPGSPSRLGLGGSMRVTEDRLEWTSRVMAAIARLQAYDALRLTQAPPVQASGAAPDVATGRLATDSPEPAPLPPLEVPGLEAPESLEGIPFLEIADALRAHDGVRAIATHGGITASFPVAFEGDPHDVILFEIRVGSRPRLGNGVWVSMSLPVSAPAHLLHALALNEAELDLRSPTDLIGGWLVRNQALVYQCFVPWTLCGGEVIRHLADAAVRRAAWLRLIGASIVPAEWPDESPGRVLPFRRSS